MANVDRPNGFRPVKSMLGAPWNGLARRYEAGDRSADTTNSHGDIYIGDPVKLTSGKVFPANSGDTILGVVVGVGKSGVIEHGDVGAFNADDLTKNYLPLADSGYVWVVPAEGMLFEIQTAAALSLVAGSAADISVDATEAHGSQTTGLSNVELVTAVNSDVEVVEDNTAPDNDVTLINARHMVQFLTVQHAQ